MSSESRDVTLPIPNGWFAVAFSKDLVDGEVERVRAFGEDLVLFRTRSGRPAVLDAYCPHLGAHLAEGGRVVGESVRCPFHGWQWDADGNCAAIPYCERIPPTAKTRAWPVIERNRLVFVWHHSEGKPPSWDFPAAPELHDPDWTEPRTFELKVPVHSQDMHENNLDPVHFQFVHGMLETPPSEIVYAEGGRFMRVQHTAEHEFPFGTFRTTLIRDSWGLGLSSVRTEGIPGAGLYMYSSTTPIDHRNTHSRWLLTVTKNLADVAGEEFIQGLTTGVQQDMRIWSNKIHRPKPLLCEADTYLAEFRRWVRQFYTDPVG
ncbi:MAG TPA: aromatic ring-hydroxylating dioxygenase subunit alpha [Myxococcota bacterium]|nr:aromatic ring-hydroxylating dioxygenase subunit alpha [Myxococcota bacterium]